MQLIFLTSYLNKTAIWLFVKIKPIQRELCFKYHHKYENSFKYNPMHQWLKYFKIWAWAHDLDSICGRCDTVLMCELLKRHSMYPLCWRYDTIHFCWLYASLYTHMHGLLHIFWISELQWRENCHLCFLISVLLPDPSNYSLLPTILSGCFKSLKINCCT